MPLTCEEILAEVMRLSTEPRTDRAANLRATVDIYEAKAMAWIAEIERCVRQLDNGEVQTVPFEQVIAELRAKLR